MSYDRKFAEAYIPIDKRKIWCGNSDVTPEGYDSIGSLSQCLQKGFGCGKRARAQKIPNHPSFSLLIPITLFLLFSASLFAFLYLYKPKIVTTKDPDDIEYIDWVKFISFYVPTLILSGLFIVLIWSLFFKNI